MVPLWEVHNRIIIQNSTTKKQCIKWPQCKHILFTLLTFSGHLIIMWRSDWEWCKHVHGAMKMFFMKHTSYSFNITSKNTTFILTWHFLVNILIFFIPIYIVVLSFSVWLFYFYKSSAGASDFLTNKAIVLQFHNI